MAKPITELTKDIRKFVEEGRAAAGPKIKQSLQQEGPWWTGDFGRRWKLSNQAVKPTELKDMLRRSTPPKTARPSFGEDPALKLPIDSPLYIGNSVAYAGFAVNNPGAVVYRGNATRTYREHKEVDKRKLTSRNQDPDWYVVYTETKGLIADLDRGFASAQIR
tara:strand:- start:55 stop:543 length:489 start_codon:yes stop_codon:yes gene_type:complete